MHFFFDTATFPPAKQNPMDFFQKIKDFRPIHNHPPVLHQALTDAVQSTSPLLGRLTTQVRTGMKNEMFVQKLVAELEVKLFRTVSFFVSQYYPQGLC